MGERETWSTGEFGDSHKGAVGVLLADGTVPRPVRYQTSSSGGGRSVSHWSAYNGRYDAPQAHALRGECSCGWTGPKHVLDWDEIGDQELARAGVGVAIQCESDWWDIHLVEVEATTVPLPETVTDLLSQLTEEIEKLGNTHPLAAVRAALRLEVTAAELAFWPARNARSDSSPEQAAAALGLNEADAERVLARFSRSRRYH
ncbi:hypothetical protein ACGF0D_36170 [Kitasatospora sp. NPDC048298]|uniref:hypothetical protein n=1 Tax=Kitasatospora sp. NPDC048298 TaxID=3364049 RepID=UPI00371E2A13